MYPSSWRSPKGAQTYSSFQWRLAAATRIDGDPSAAVTNCRTSSERPTTASASHWEATAASMPSPVSRSIACRTPWTARPTAVPYRPFSQGGRSRSRGRFCKPGSSGSSSTSGSPSSVNEVAETVVGRAARVSDPSSSAFHSPYGSNGAGRGTAGCATWSPEGSRFGSSSNSSPIPSTSSSALVRASGLGELARALR